MDKLVRLQILSTYNTKKTIYDIDNWLYYKIMAKRQWDYTNSYNLLYSLYVTDIIVHYATQTTLQLIQTKQHN